MPRSNLRLYIICPEKGHLFFDKVLEGTKKAEEELEGQDVKIEYLVTPYNNISHQIQLLEQVKNIRPDGVAIIPFGTTELNLLIDETADNDIPVITFNNDAPYSKRFCFVGPDNYSSGKLCGDIIGNFLPSQSNILILSGSNHIYALKQRLLGFKDKLKSSYPELKIISTFDYSENEDICYTYIINELTNNAIDGIYVNSAIGCKAIGKALKELKPSSTPKIIGFEPDKLFAEYIDEGLFQAFIYQDPYIQGYLSLKTLYNFVATGLVPETENIYTKNEIAMQENFKNFI